MKAKYKQDNKTTAIKSQNGKLIGITQNKITTVISSLSVNMDFQEEMPELLQSKNLLNEQISLESYKASSFYELDHRVNTLFIDVLLANEKTLFTMHFVLQEKMAGLIATEGFNSAYEVMKSCTDAVQQ